MVEEGALNSTLGQRLLKEPIWIGLIVILSVLLLFGILYVVRRKCGKHFHCCDIKKPQVDDNILNEDGTITLNSFPLRKIARTTMLSPISTSSSSPHALTTKIEEEGSSAGVTPTARNEGAAARFFASYKNAEKTPIAAPLTTDFSRTTDTSLSQEADDATVGAMVGGRLQLDLHIRENKVHEEAMSRSSSLLDPSTTSRLREKIKRSHSTGPYLVRQATQFDELAVSVSKGNCERIERDEDKVVDKGKKKETINDFQHIYPHVIVQAVPGSDGERDDGSVTTSDRHNFKLPDDLVPGLAYTDHSGARVLAVSLEGESDGNDSLVRSESCVSPSQVMPSMGVHSSKDTPKLEQLQLSFEEQALREQEKLKRYVASISEWKDRARLRYKLAKMTSLQSSEEYPQYPARYRDHRHSSKYSGRSSIGLGRRNRSSVHPLRRTYTADTDRVYFSDVSRRREKFSRKAGRLTTSMEDIECDRHRYLNSHGGRDFSQSSCECPECDHIRDLRQYNRVQYRTRDRSERGNRGNKSGYPKEKHKHRHFSITDETQELSSRYPKDRNGSNRLRWNREHNYSDGRLSNSSRRNREYSSTESDVTRKENSVSPHLSMKKKIMHRSSTTPSNHPKAQSIRSKAYLDIRSQTSLPSDNAPEILISEIPSLCAEKDLFRKVFSQEIELDDFSPVEEDDNDFVFSSNSNTKESLLGDTTLLEFGDDCGTAALTMEPTLMATARKRLPSTLKVPRPHPLSEPSSPQLKHKASDMALVVEEERMEHSPRLNFSDKFSKNSSESPCTPTTCNVIVYDSTANGVKIRKPNTIKSERFLSRKHSSLELVNNDRLSPPNTASIRSVASMHDLSGDSQMSSTDAYRNWTSPAATHEASSCLAYSDSFSSKSLQRLSTSNPNIPNSFQSSSSGICLASYEEDSRDINSSSNDFQLSDSNGNRHQNLSETILPNREAKFGNNQQIASSHLSVTDTDSAMSSVPSPHSTPTDSKMVQSFERAGLEPKVKDSAYQTKQGSMETETYLEARARRPAPGGRLPFLTVHPRLPCQLTREEERKVTQRLHQAAVKLLVMQQRLRRARQNLSRDSAVHTISEDDPSLDDITVTSPKSRTFKPGVLYPVPTQGEDHFPELPPLHCDRIVEEQDTLTEYEV